MGHPFRDQKAIEQAKILIEADHTDKQIEHVIEFMSFIHILLPYEYAEKHFELATREVTLTSFAIKQIAFAAACETPGAFGNDKSDVIVHRLLEIIWKILSKDDLFQVPHCFLQYKVRILALSSITADHWLYLNMIIKEQCRQVYRKLCGKPLVQYHVEPMSSIPDEDELIDVTEADVTPQHLIQSAHRSKARVLFLLNALQKAEPDNPQWTSEVAKVQVETQQQAPDFAVIGHDTTTVPSTTQTTMPYSAVLTMNPMGRFLAPLYDDADDRKTLVEKLTEQLKEFNEEVRIKKTYLVANTKYQFMSIKNCKNILIFSSIERMFCTDT